MTIEDLIESGIDIDGMVCVTVRSRREIVEVFEGDGYELANECNKKWYGSFPITYIYPSPIRPDYLTIEVDEKERS